MPGLMRSADLLVHAAEVELEGMVLLEALGTGLPALVAEAPLSAASTLAVSDDFRFPVGRRRRAGPPDRPPHRAPRAARRGPPGDPGPLPRGSGSTPRWRSWRPSTSGWRGPERVTPAGRSRRTSHSAPGSAVKSASIASRKAPAVTSPNCRSGGKCEKASPRKPGGVDQRGEDDGPARDPQRVPQRSVEPTRALPLLQVVEEVDLVVLGGAEHGGGDEDGGHVERAAEEPHPEEGDQDGEDRRDHRHQPRRRAAEHEQEGGEDERRGEGEALGQRGHEARAHLGLEDATRPPPACSRRGRPGRRPPSRPRRRRRSRASAW